MLTNLWWPNASPASANRSKGDGDEKDRAASTSLFGEDLIMATEEEEDALVDKLLTQFPVYGSKPPLSQPLSRASAAVSSAKIPTAQEWLQMGVGLEEEEEPFEYSSHTNRLGKAGPSSSSLVNTNTSSSAAATPNRTNNGNDSGGTIRRKNNNPQSSTNSSPNSNTIRKESNEDWDLEERSLWKETESSPRSSPTTVTEPRQRHQIEQEPSQRLGNQSVAKSQAKSLSAAAATTAAVTMQTISSPMRSLLSSRDDRQHWMPDQLCKQCYSCDQPFTVFRRRHHCRLCGQVFCTSCSANFVQARASTIRVCQLCFDQVQQGGAVLPLLEDEDEELDNDGVLADPVQTAFRDPVDVDMTLSSPLQPSKKQTSSADALGTPVAATNATGTTTTSDSVRSKEINPFPNPDAFAAATDKRSTGVSGVGRRPAASALTRIKRPVKKKILDPTKEGHRQLGMAAADHLEMITAELLRIHAPLLWNSLSSLSTRKGAQDKRDWINKLLSLATKCCSTVDPKVKRGGDLLDIRPYCKLKVIAGGSCKDCAYMSGVVFRKTVSHKKMAKEVLNPRIMLLSGGIEFTRAENQIASLDTLFEQEGKYMEILVGKILKLKPDVLLVGRSVSRGAQELFLKAGVVLVQHVKSSLMSRISRQTGATIISSTDHIMNQFAGKVLGKCGRFRLVSFRDNELWVDHGVATTNDREGDSSELPARSIQRSVEAILADTSINIAEREAALAAKQLGERVIDGSVAVKSGLAKRGVTNTYIMLEGCPRHLGCTIVLRGAPRAALKEVKSVFRFLINVAYNLKLETSFFRERGARLRPGFKVLPQHVQSSSLAVDYGSPPGGRKVTPWNGGNTEKIPPRRPEAGVTAFDHQSILITSIWMTSQTQCCPAEVKGICYYSLQDVALGQFLRDSCFNLSLKCQNPNCKKSVLDHSLSFVHNDGLINITVEEMEASLPNAGDQARSDSDDATTDDEDEETNQPIATWTYCRNCRKVVTPLVFISENTWKFSFGKFLESFFYNRDAVINAPNHQCSCHLQSASVLYFGCGKLAARFTYEPVSPYGVCVRKFLPIRLGWHRREAMRMLEIISAESSVLFVKFDKHIDKVSREARSLFQTATARPEHLQTVLSELNKVGSEVDHAAKTLQEKIASVTDSFRQTDDGAVNDTILRFPWIAKRYIFMLMTSWNEKLRAAGQAISAMKKLSGVLGNAAAVVGDPLQDELIEGLKRLKQLNEQYSRYNVTDITQSLPSLPGGAAQADGDYDDEFDDPENAMDFSDGVDADVLASRRRLKHSRPSSGSLDKSAKNSKTKSSGQPSPTKSLGTRRSVVGSSALSSVDASVTAAPKPTPGGAVKSAITRFFNRGGRDYENYVIDLGIFSEGTPRLAPGVNGEVVPVIDEQLSTIIAYALVCPEYAKQFKQFAKSDAGLPDDESMPVKGSGQTEKRSKDSRSRPELPSTPRCTSPINSDGNTERDVERRMLNRKKSHIKITFRDYDEKGRVVTKYVCNAYWSLQFQAVRECFLKQAGVKIDDTDDDLRSDMDTEQSYIRSLSSAYSWNASGGKSGATFARTSDDRFVIKNISKTELQMFLECSSAYFEYLTKAFFHGLPTVLCKIVGVYRIDIHNRVTGKRTMEQVAVMQNMFYNKKITQIFDLKGSLRGRFAAQIQRSKDDASSDQPSDNPKLSRRQGSNDRWPDDNSSARDGDNSLLDGSDGFDAEASSRGQSSGPATLLDGDFLEFTKGRPMPLTDRAKALFQMSILNDTLFLSIINVLDYSILVGVDDDSKELVVGIIDFMRQYDILKQMERVGKSLPMVVGSEAPTIIQPPLYKQRFTNAMERYFMTVPSKWTTI